MTNSDPAGRQQAIADEIRSLEEQWAQAFTLNDADGIARILDADWMLIGPNGRIIDKPTFVDLIRSGVLTHEQMDFDDITIRVYGSTALLTGRATVRGHFQGEAFSTQERSTDLFIHKGDCWVCVFTQLTAITPTE